MKKDVLLFDLDGTLVDTRKGIQRGLIYTLARFGIEEVPENLNGYIGPPLQEALAKYHNFSPEMVEKAVPVFRQYYAQNGIKGNGLFPGVERMLRIFSGRGKILAVATSKPEESAVPILEEEKISGCFRLIGGNTLSHERPRKVDVIEYVLRSLQIEDRSRVVLIGDRNYDVEGARQAGIDSIGILYGYGSREELEQAGATLILPGPEELLEEIE